MDNYKQKLFLLCALLVGCILTSVAVEYWFTPDEPIKISPPVFLEQSISKREKAGNSKESASNLNESFDFQQKPQKLKAAPEKYKVEAKKVTAVININTATISELDSLPGIGPAIAKRIVEFRTQQPFTKIEDIMLVKGIGKKKFAKMRERITVE